MAEQNEYIQIQHLESLTAKIFGEIVPGVSYNVDIDFSSSLNANEGENVYEVEPGVYSLEAPPPPKENKKNESIYVCETCKSERWIPTPVEKKINCQCYICGTIRNFSRKTY